MLVPPPKALPISSVRAVAEMSAVIRANTNAQGLQRSRVECGAIAKLPMDFVRQARLRAAMDEDTLELTARLCTRIGMIMEDASVIALTIGAASEADRMEALAQLDAASGRISDLVRAVRAVQS